MCGSEIRHVAVSENGINYYVLTGNNADRCYGIAACLENDKDDSCSLENIFFSEEEATRCCQWLAENSVFPITLSEVISDLYHSL